MGLKDYTDLNKINDFCKDTLFEHLDIIITKFGEDYVCGKMPVTAKSVQPARILHGGASCVLAESLGSLASYLLVDRDKFTVVGQSLNAHYLRPAHEGETVFAKATIIHQGRRSHIWDIDIKNKDEKIVARVRLTNAIIKKD